MLRFAIIFLFHLFSVVNFFKIRFFMFYTLFFQFVSVKDTIFFWKHAQHQPKKERENKFPFLSLFQMPPKKVTKQSSKVSKQRWHGANVFRQSWKFVGTSPRCSRNWTSRSTAQSHRWLNCSCCGWTTYEGVKWFGGGGDDLTTVSMWLFLKIHGQELRMRGVNLSLETLPSAIRPSQPWCL